MKTKHQIVSDYFDTGVTAQIAWRKTQLRGLRAMMEDNLSAWLEALQVDLHKSPQEAVLTEIAVVQSEIDYALGNLSKWNRPERLKAPVAFQPIRTFAVHQPLGPSLVIAPWNYPVQLVLLPLVGALAAGNTVVIKPSEYAVATQDLLAELVPQYLDKQAVVVATGGAEATEDLLHQHWAHIFYTGSTRVGKLVMKAASENLTPVTLELGGKSPVWFNHQRNLERACRRLTWAKYTNAGQTCVAPDYVIAPPEQVDLIVNAMQDSIESLYGAFPRDSGDYGRIINTGHFARLVGMLEESPVSIGGGHNEEDLYIEPTVVVFDSIAEAKGHPLMQEEIFGPILPIIKGSFSEMLRYVNAGPSPLTSYAFTDDKQQYQTMMTQISSGSLARNVGLLQAGATTIPFGGVGASGMGRYHGKETWRLFSNRKIIMSKPLWPDTLRLIQPPVTELVRTVTRWISRLQ